MVSGVQGLHQRRCFVVFETMCFGRNGHGKGMDSNGGFSHVDVFT